MNVLMLITYPEIGGTETHVVSLAKELETYGVHIGLATRGGPFVSTFRQNGIRIHKLPSSRNRSRQSTVSRICHIVQKYSYDIIHAHDTESFLLLPKLKDSLRDVSLLMTVHGMYHRERHVQQAAHAARRIIAVSPYVQDWLKNIGVRGSKTVFIPNGVDVRQFVPSSSITDARNKLQVPGNAHLVLYAGRFQADKWMIAQKLILAGEHLARKDNRLMIVLVGPGSYGAQLRKMAAKVNRRVGRVVISVRPPVRHLSRYYRAASIVTGTGRVALEAMACGKAVIAAGKGGFEGIVSSDSIVRAIYNNFGDHQAPHRVTTSRLAVSIQSLLSNQARVESLGRYGCQIVRRKFSISRVSRSTYELYRYVLRSRRNH